MLETLILRKFRRNWKEILEESTKMLKMLQVYENRGEILNTVQSSFGEIFSSNFFYELVRQLIDCLNYQ